MKKIYTLLLLGILNMTQAQVPNSNFETGTGYGLENVAAWGNFFIYTIAIDVETGENTQDEIIFGDSTLGSFCTSTLDAHTGERAMLIRNAFNVTQNQVIPGEANLFDTEISDTPTGWNFGVPVDSGAEIDQLSFWYKFAPLGNDVAEAKLTLFADGVGEVGSAKITITGTHDQYTYATVPVAFTSLEAPTFMTIAFTMAPQGSTPVFGSHLTVDDLKVNNLLNVADFETDSLTIFPTMTQNTLNIQSASDDVFTMKIIDLQGKTVWQNHSALQKSVAESIDVSQLASGVYILKAESNAKQVIKKFIKK